MGSRRNASLRNHNRGQVNERPYRGPYATACFCEERSKPVDNRKWVVRDRHCNHSAFNGYRYTPSDYSSVVCYGCGATWRTKAAYVDSLRNESTEELRTGVYKE